MKIKLNWLWVLLLVLPLAVLGCAPKAAPPAPLAVTKEYVLIGSADFTGPYADIFKWAQYGDTAMQNWWNENNGKKLGVKITAKWIDCRYDTATTASQYAGLVPTLKPLGWIGAGGPDVAALKERVPTDKVPLLMGSAGYGYDWVAGMKWIIHYRPTYVHEAAATVDWILDTWPKEKLPIRIVTVTSDVSPAYVDIEKGFAKAMAMDKYKGKVEYLGAAWVPMVPVDMTDVMRPFIAKGANLVYGFTNISQNVATYKACTALGKKVPIIVSTHNGLMSVARALDWAKMEGFMEVGAMQSPLNYESAAFKEIWSKYHQADITDVKSDFDLNTIRWMANRLLFCKAAEQAIADVGADKLTGEAIYNAYLKIDLSEKDCMGLIRSAKWGMDSPFPNPAGLGVQIGTVKDGKYTLATPNWVPIPEVPKW